MEIKKSRGSQHWTLSFWKQARSVARRIAQQMKVVKGGKSAQFSDVAVLYRSNYQSQALEDAFKRNGIPYALGRGSTPFWERQEVRKSIITSCMRVLFQDKIQQASIVLPRRVLAH
jgi:DNA helicase-2/ATP-dependent DNA helicase PcrA